MKMCPSVLFLSFVNTFERKSEIYECTIIRTVFEMNKCKYIYRAHS
jgi:hypothetical protein